MRFALLPCKKITSLSAFRFRIALVGPCFAIVHWAYIYFTDHAVSWQLPVSSIMVSLICRPPSFDPSPGWPVRWFLGLLLSVMLTSIHPASGRPSTVEPSTLPLRYLLSELFSWEQKRNALRAIARELSPSAGPSEATLQLPIFFYCFLNTQTQGAVPPMLFSTRDSDWLPSSSHWLLRPIYGKSITIRSVPLQAVNRYWRKFLEDTSQTIHPPLRLPAEIILISVWKSFWALPLPQAVITPWWRLLHNSIGVASKIFRWNPISFPSPLYRFCTGAEDTFHFVVGCPTKWLLWSAALAEMNLASCFKTSENVWTALVTFQVTTDSLQIDTTTMCQLGFILLLYGNNTSLPTEIFDDLEYSRKNTLKTKLKQFAKEANKYGEGRWTQSGTVNKIYLLELKKHQVDAAQTITAFTKGAGRLWTAGRAATDIYQGFHHDIENSRSEEMRHILEKIRCLAVYSLGTGKELGKYGKDLAAKALKQPESLKNLEDEDEDGKDYFFSSNVVEKIQQAGLEETIIKGITQPKFWGFNKNGSTRRGRKLYGNKESFFGRDRGRGVYRSQATTKSKSFLLEHNKIGGITCFTIAVGTIGCHRICFKHSNVPNVATIFQDCLLSLTDSSSSVLSSIGSDSSDIYDREINNTK
ncbi:hypothetical protein G6F57_010404 [Rhizopus arrhizus]|nr:hypothetical protein G6F24_005056 [Rhizopus arrhizus]KAG0791228.1 hypothetical protein G6F21_005232 [Rhizopus arrhizus]KAG0796269.1 hypothetical protein G6F22_004942 [Rhizopus arrhizus]KAG0854421.1 hypothetical protein G6F17_006362 [Rhizopus arrhizus]KAG0864868.1 hypothetical protein G6F16_010678 [Rhizopus arrhizus]